MSGLFVICHTGNIYPHKSQTDGQHMEGSTLPSHFYRYLISLLLFALVASSQLQSWSFSQPLSLAIEDSKFTLREILFEPRPLPEDVAIIEIDESSINQYGRWPWSRERMADLLAKLAEADQVVLDIVFSESSEPQSDLTLSRQMAEQGNIILGFFLRQQASQTFQPDELWQLSDCAYFDISVAAEVGNQAIPLQEFDHAEINLAIFQQAAKSCAVFSTMPDADGLFRKYPLGYLYQDQLYPPLAIQGLRISKQQEANIILGSHGIDEFNFLNQSISKQNYLPLNFYNNVKSFSAADILNATPGDAILAQLKNKILFIGLTELGIYDMRPTPVDPVTPGVYLHYTAAANFIDGSVLHDSDMADTALLVLVLILCLLIASLQHQALRLFLYAALFVLILSIALGSFVFLHLWLHEAHSYLLILLLMVFLEAQNFLYTSREAAKIRGAFSSYVSPALVRRISEDPSHLQLGGSEKQITVLFADLRGFTTLSEGLTPTELVSLLNEIFEPMTNAVIAHEGMLDKYMGDAMMAIFNAPLDIKYHPRQAFYALRDMQASLKDLNNERLNKGQQEIHLGIGLNTGMAVVGNMGSSIRFSYTALGDAVNLASRLESLTKSYGCDFLLSDESYQLLSEQQQQSLHCIDRVAVSGRNQATKIYTCSEHLNQQQKETFALALKEYLAGNFNQAREIWSSLAELDACAATMAQRCLLLAQQSESWPGFYRFDHK